MSEQQLADSFDAYIATASNDVLVAIYDQYVSTGTYDDNLAAFGVVSRDAPSSINIYADSFEDKDHIADAITDYNNTVSKKDKITYTDYVGLMMSSVTTIVNVISYVLIAFVSVSLIVSSIMIGIITYISVLERTRKSASYAQWVPRSTTYPRCSMRRPASSAYAPACWAWA